MFFLTSENIFQCGQGILYLPVYPSQSEHLPVVSLDYLAHGGLLEHLDYLAHEAC